MAFMFKIPLLIFHIVKEHFLLKKIIRKHNIDIVISDNRFGLWNRKVKTVYITHQLRIKFPRLAAFAEPVGMAIHRLFINKYDYCFIPDLPDSPDFSGILSHGCTLPPHAMFIGILSRFSASDRLSDLPDEIRIPYDTVILSGPEPQKSLLKKMLISSLKDSDTTTVFLCAEPASKTDIIQENSHIICYTHLSTSMMKQVIVNSRHVITRSGYSSVMELLSLGRSALLIPTPGQTEQEYLADYLSKRGLFTCLKQKELKTKKPTDFIEMPNLKSIIMESGHLLNKALDKLLDETTEKRQ